MCYPFSLNPLKDTLKVLNDQLSFTGGPSSINFPGNYC